MEENRFVVHYYLNNPDLHQLDAKLFNSNEAIIISIIELISKTLDVKLDIKISARQEGGVVDNIIIKVLSNPFISNCISTIISGLFVVFLTQDKELTNLQKEALREQINYYKRQNQDNLEIKNPLTTISNKLDLFTDVNTSNEIKKKQNSIYKSMSCNEDIRSFAIEKKDNDAITTLGNVPKEDFNKFILPEPQKEEIIDENATIDIISPVLSDTSRLNWDGIYKRKHISFSMGDKEFKERIMSENLQFGANNILSARLKYTKTTDEHGIVDFSNYSVIEVFGTDTRDGGYIDMSKPIKRRKSEDTEKLQYSFDLEEEDDD